MSNLNEKVIIINAGDVNHTQFISRMTSIVRTLLALPTQITDNKRKTQKPTQMPLRQRQELIKQTPVASTDRKSNVQLAVKL